MEDIVNKRKPQYGKVKKLVNKVLEDNCITNPPIDIKDLINNYGLKLKFARFPEEMSGVCGFLDINEEAIYVNADNSLKRQNFTIAHELGHWLLHREEINKSPQSYKVLRRQPIGGEKIIEKQKQTHLQRICWCQRICLKFVKKHLFHRK